MVSATGTRDPKRVCAGQIGARQRWGEPRIARLDELTADQRRLVMALIGAIRGAKETAPTNETSGAVTTEGHGNDRPSS